MEEAIRTAYSLVTEQLTGISFETAPARKKRIESPVSVVVLSKGTFRSKTVGVFPEAFTEAVVDRMGADADMSEEDRDAYFKEYLNMFYGRFISKVNDAIGKASRFVIPVIMRGTYRETTAGTYRNMFTFDLVSELGRVCFDVYYEILPQYSSN